MVTSQDKGVDGPPRSIDWVAITPQLLKVARRSTVENPSQTGLSEQLGFKSNVVYLWETGRRKPKTNEYFKLVEHLGTPLNEILVEFFGELPSWASEFPLTTRKGVALLLNEYWKEQSLSEVSQTVDVSRLSIKKWLCGETCPALPDFLQLFDLLSARSLELLSLTVDLRRIPLVREIWEIEEAARKRARDPWYTVLRMLKKNRPDHPTERLPELLPEYRDALSRALTIHGQEFEDLDVVLRLALRSDPLACRALRVWTGERLRTRRSSPQTRDQFTEALFTLSRSRLEQAKEIQMGAFRAIKALVTVDDEKDVDSTPESDDRVLMMLSNSLVEL